MSCCKRRFNMFVLLMVKPPNPGARFVQPCAGACALVCLCMSVCIRVCGLALAFWGLLTSKPAGGPQFMFQHRTKLTGPNAAAMLAAIWPCLALSSRGIASGPMLHL